jgi:hypothetical protein
MLFDDFCFFKFYYCKINLLVKTITTVTTVTTATTVTTVTTVRTIIVKYQMLLLYSRKGNFSQRTDRPTNN